MNKVCWLSAKQQKPTSWPAEKVGFQYLMLSPPPSAIGYDVGNDGELVLRTCDITFTIISHNESNGNTEFSTLQGNRI
jgi:hypothetical protein